MLLDDLNPPAAVGAAPGPRRFLAAAPQPHPDDAARASVIAELMSAEITELDHLIEIASTRWADRVDAGWGNACTPEPLLRLRAKRDELQRFLDRLRSRFAAE